MQRCFRWACFLLGMAIVVPALATAQSPAPKPKLYPAGSIQAVVTKVDVSGRTIWVKVGNQSTDVRADEDTKIRVVKPPASFDDKGNIKEKFTPEELKKYKGPDPRAWGYTGDFESLRSGSIVQIFLAKKPFVRPKPGEEPDPDANRPVITEIRILGDVPPGVKY
ncbi:MAG: hypothetical protein ACK4RK_15220 [Gemmataceae bacterium]